MCSPIFCVQFATSRLCPKALQKPCRLYKARLAKGTQTQTNAALAETVQQGAPVDATAAAEPITDWLETHGGEVRLTGPAHNLARLSDDVAWSTRFLFGCGRLVPFIRRCGVFSGPDVVTKLRMGSAGSGG